MYRQRIWGWAGAAIITLSALGGCGHSAPPDTGAKAVAERYLQAFQKQDWSGAYGTLDSDTRARDSVDQFTQWATDYSHRLGFDVETFFVVSCTETGDRAMAQATLGGHAKGASGGASGGGARHQTKNTAIMLQRRDGHWGVVLPAAALPQTAPAK